MLLGQAVQSKLTLIGTYVYFARLKHQRHCNVQHIRKEQMLVHVIDTLLKIKFQELDYNPAGVDIQHLNIDPGLENILYEHSAAWHKSWRNKIGNDKLQRASKRKTE